MNGTTDDTGLTPLMRAAMNGRDESIDVLINAGADVNTRDKMGRTALFLATSKGITDSVITLIRGGADVNMDDIHGNTPVMELTSSDEFNEKILQQFLYAGAKVNVVNKFGHNALEDYIVNAEPIVERIAMILCAAGEKIDLSSMIFHRTQRLYHRRDDLPESLCNIVYNEGETLMTICRAAIRTYLLEQDSVNLFLRIPFLKLPSLLTEFLLYDVSIDDVDDSGDND